MHVRQKINTVYKKIRRVPVRYLFLGGIVFVMLLYVVAFREQTLAYNYGGETCKGRLVLLPGIFKQAGCWVQDNA